MGWMLQEPDNSLQEPMSRLVLTQWHNTQAFCFEWKTEGWPEQLQGMVPMP